MNAAKALNLIDDASGPVTYRDFYAKIAATFNRVNPTLLPALRSQFTLYNTAAAAGEL